MKITYSDPVFTTDNAGRTLVSSSRVAYWVLGLGAFFLTVHFTLSGSIGSKEFGAAILSLVGTFTGAWLAFKRDQIRDKTEQDRKLDEAASALRSRRIAAIHRALFVIGAQNNEILQIVEAIAPYRDSENRDLHLPAISPPGTPQGRVSQSLDDLLFFIDLDESNLLFDLMIEQRRFEAAIEMVEHRLQLHRGEFQSALDASYREGRLPRNSEVPVDTVRDAVGPKLAVSLRRLTDQLYDHVDGVAETLPKMRDAFIQVASRKFSGHAFTSYMPRVTPEA